MSKIRVKILHIMSFDENIENFDTIRSEIEKGLVFKGANLWILVLAVFVASVGLNMNSTAVIIGAMLISPLMGPIIAMGFSIATYDYSLLRRGLKDFLFSVVTSLIASTVYFLLSPVTSEQSELIARTSPTIYDVLIATFGGLAGVIALSSKTKGNVVPGVAIATALMPPLCTAGYGIATGKLDFFLGALFLFSINTVFIAVSALVVTRFLKFPIHDKMLDELHRKRVNRWISIIITVTVLPSIYFGYTLVQREKFMSSAKDFVQSVSSVADSYLLTYEIKPVKRTIRLTFGGRPLTDSSRRAVYTSAISLGVNAGDIIIREGYKSAAPTLKMTEVDQLRTQLLSLKDAVYSKNKTIDSIMSQPEVGKVLISELKILYPQIISCAYANGRIYTDTSDAADQNVIILIGVKKKLSKSEYMTVKRWLLKRLQINSLKLIEDVVNRNR